MKGITGDTITETGTLASASRRIIFRRVAGEAVRGSSPRLISGFSEVVLIAALLMVSRVLYAHLINRFVRGRKKFRQVVICLLLVMLVVWHPQITVIVAIYVYALSAPVAALWRRPSRNRTGNELPPAAGGKP